MTPQEYWDNAAKDPDVLTKYICDPIFNTEDFVEVIEEQVEDWDKISVMEIGCGIGRLIVPLADKHKECKFYGVDLSDEMIKLCPKRENIKYQTPPPTRVDYVYSVLTFQHIPEAEKRAILAALKFTLKKGGTLYFQFVVGDVDDGVANFQTSIDKMTKACEQAGFTIEKVHPNFMHPEWCFIKAIK